MTVPLPGWRTTWKVEAKLYVVPTDSDDSGRLEHLCIAWHCGIFADDVLCYRSGLTSDSARIASREEICSTDINDLRSAQRLQLNAYKTELLWFCPASQLCQLSSDNLVISLKPNLIKPSSVVRDMGVLFDVDISMRQHVFRLQHRQASSTASSAPSLSSTWSWRHYQTGHSSRAVALRLLSRCSPWFTSFDANAFADSLARRSANRTRPETSWTYTRQRASNNEQDQPQLHAVSSVPQYVRRPRALSRSAFARRRRSRRHVTRHAVFTWAARRPAQRRVGVLLLLLLVVVVAVYVDIL